jgi:hypothetical protein
MWAKRAGGAGADQGLGLAVDDTGNSYVTGFFTGSATLGPDEALEITLSGTGEEIFVAKFGEPTPQQLIAALIAEVEALQAGGSLNGGQANALLTKLGAAIQKLDQENKTAAINQLQAFINQVQAFINGGVLTLAEGQPLIDQANVIITTINASMMPKQASGFPSESSSVPNGYTLEQNYPNPFWSAVTSRLAGNPTTAIRFALPQASHVAVKIFNMRGQEIRTLTEAHYEAGYYSMLWDGKDNHGQLVPSGVYLYKLQVNGFEETRKMTFMK